MDKGIEEKDSSQLHEEIQDTEDAKTENSPTRTLEASPPSPQFKCPFEGCGEHFTSQSELIAHMDKESAEARHAIYGSD
jgi:hypothetical protein